jgi:hypothetical protein
MASLPVITASTSGSPDEGPVRAETGREQPHAGSSFFSSSTNVQPAPENNGHPQQQQQKKKPRKKKVEFSDTDYSLIYLTHFTHISNGSYRPWNNKTWEDMGPKYLLTRHPPDSIRKIWSNQFAVDTKSILKIQEAIRWTGSHGFRSFAIKELNTDPWLLVLHEKNEENYQRIQSLVTYVARTYHRLGFPINQENIRLSLTQEGIEKEFKRLGIWKKTPAQLASLPETLALKPKQMQTIDKAVVIHRTTTVTRSIQVPPLVHTAPRKRANPVIAPKNEQLEPKQKPETGLSGIKPGDEICLRATDFTDKIVRAKKSWFDEMGDLKIDLIDDSEFPPVDSDFWDSGADSIDRVCQELGLEVASVSNDQFELIPKNHGTMSGSQIPVASPGMNSSQPAKAPTSAATSAKPGI